MLHFSRFSGRRQNTPEKDKGPREEQENIMVKHLTAFYLTALAALAVSYPIITVLGAF